MLRRCVNEDDVAVGKARFAGGMTYGIARGTGRAAEGLGLGGLPALAICAEALEACKAALRPGRPIGEVFDAHARVMDANGLRHARLNACGYSLGAVFAPIWMDFPMFYHGNPVEAAPGMVFFLHMILMDSDAQLAMSLGETVIVTDGAPERLSAMPLELVTK